VSNWTKFGVGALAVAMALGCSDSTGTNGDTLTTAEKQALTQALSSTEFGSLAAFVVQAVGQVGTLDAATVNSAIQSALDKAISLSVTGAQSADYEGAVGIALEFDYNVQGDVFAGWFYGVFGWNDINTNTNSVGEWVIVGASGESGSLPSSASGTIDSGNIFAEYAMNSAYYFGTSGSATIGGNFGGSSTDCSASQQGITIDCAYTTGSMNGSFNFSALSSTETTYTQTPVTFTGLPAVKMTLSISD